MTAAATGVFETYAEAGAVVRELELLGISGARVEVVSDAGRDVRGEGFVPPPEHRQESAPSPEITLVIVRAADDVGFEQAKSLMQNHGAKVWQIPASAKVPTPPPKPPLPPNPAGPPHAPASEGSRGSGIGGRGATANDPTDLEGHGKSIDIRNPGTPGEKETGVTPDPDNLPM
jgi:hypothetical protein